MVFMDGLTQKSKLTKIYYLVIVKVNRDMLDNVANLQDANEDKVDEKIPETENHPVCFKQDCFPFASSFCFLTLFSRQSQFMHSAVASKPRYASTNFVLLLLDGCPFRARRA